MISHCVLIMRPDRTAISPATDRYILSDPAGCRRRTHAAQHDVTYTHPFLGVVELDALRARRVLEVSAAALIL